MRLAILIGMFFLMKLDVASQSLYSDSLKRDLNSYTRKDSLLILKMARYASSFRQTNPVKAIELYELSISKAREIGWLKPIPYLFLQIASIHSLAEKYDAAISYCLEALKASEDNRDVQPNFDIYFELSEAYRLLDDHVLAALYAQMALAIAEKEKSKERMLSAQFILAGSYVNRDRWDSASLLLDKTMKMAIDLKNEYMQEQVKTIWADHMTNIKNFNGALALYRNNLQFQYKTNNQNGIAWVYSVLAMLYTDLNKKDSAYACADSALAISKRFSLAKELKDAYNALFYSHHAFGDFKTALEYRLLYDSIYMANFNVAAGKTAERARIELDQQRKDALTLAEKLKSDARTRTTRNLLLGALVFFALIVGFLFWNNRQKQRANKVIEKAYADLKSTQALLIQSEKMASLGELTAGIAHEIQNPLNFVNNFSEVSKELIEEVKSERSKRRRPELVEGERERDEILEEELLNDIAQNLEKINHHGKRAEAIVKGMLQHSRSSTGQKEPTDINALCDEYLRLAYHGLKARDKSIEASFRFEPDITLPKMNLVPQDIGRVLLNLINNAFQAVNGFGDKPMVTVTTQRRDSMVEIVVADNGPGIPEAIRDKIFQPFFTTKPTGQGTGLGLSLSYDIVKAHGGELKVETKEGEGTVFIVLLNVIAK